MIDIPDGDFSFDPLCDAGGPLDPEPVDDDAADAENRVHVALFAHVGVEDPADWRSVAIGLACMYKPDLLMGSGPCKPAVPAKGGRRKTRTDQNLVLLKSLVDVVMNWSRDGRIAAKYKDARNACEYIVNPRNSDVEFIRYVLDLKPGANPLTLANKYGIAKKLAAGATDHGNA